MARPTTCVAAGPDHPLHPAVIVGLWVAPYFDDSLYQPIRTPTSRRRSSSPKGTESEAVLSGVAAGLTLQLKLRRRPALVGACNWLDQIWAFIPPGPHATERKWSRIFAAIAGPALLRGAAVGDYVLPKAITVLIGFTRAA